MSHFTKVKTKMKDGEILVKLLQEMAYNVDVHDVPVTIQGYSGQTDEANIVVTKDQFGGYGDLGYRKDGQEMIEIVDSGDKNKIFSKCGGYNRFQMNYSTEVVKQEHTRIPGTISTTQKDIENGNILVETIALVEN